MANSVSQNLKAFLQSDTTLAGAVGARIHQNHRPMSVVNGQLVITSPGDYIWFARDSVESERALGDTTGATPFRHFYDVEVVARQPTQAETIAARIFAICDAITHGATFGDSTVQGIFVSRQGGDYQMRNLTGDSGFHIEAMRLEIVPT